MVTEQLNVKYSSPDKNYPRARSLSKDREPLNREMAQPHWVNIYHGQRGPDRSGGKKHFPEKINQPTEIQKAHVFQQREMM